MYAIRSYYAKHIKVTRAGREYKACCPFHHEKTASFTINDDKGFYHCFGCGAHGDVVKFMTDYRNLSFMEAVEYLCGYAGIEVPKQNKEEDVRYQKQKIIYNLLAEVSKYFHQEIKKPENKKKLQYLIDRGVITSYSIHYTKLYEDKVRGIIHKIVLNNFSVVVE